MLALSCDRCGRTFPAEAATILREPAEVVYLCPQDGAGLMHVGRGKFGKGGGDVSFQHGDAVVKIPGEEVPFSEFMNELYSR
jgi:ssDNA-binding Zn-finger/Zn-ribbon topoisomerase 1